MASLHRIQWIDANIRRGHHPNIQRIMDEFEISRRQALRDIEYLRDSLGAPVEYGQQHKGYYYTDQSFVIPGLLMTELQKELLSCLAAHYGVLAKHDKRTSTAFTDLAVLLQRLSGNEGEPVKINRNPRDGLIPFQAILQRQSTVYAIHDVPTSLRPFYRGKNERNHEVYEFYESIEFIPALLASGLTYSVIHPKWLRSKLVQYLEKMQHSNQIG